MSALDAKQQGLLAKHPANPNPITDHPTTATKQATSSLKDTIAAHKRAKATGTEIPLRPRSVITPPTAEVRPLASQTITQASVEEDTSLDYLFIEKEDAKEDAKPQQDSIFGAKRANDAKQNPQQEQVSRSASLTSNKRIRQMLTRSSAPKRCEETASWPPPSSSQARRQVSRGCLFHKAKEEQDET